MCHQRAIIVILSVVQTALYFIQPEEIGKTDFSKPSHVISLVIIDTSIKLTLLIFLKNAIPGLAVFLSFTQFIELIHLIKL